jgi:GNAT superfamily N-acetyltransferase
MVRPAAFTDIARIVSFIRKLAEYEKLEHQLQATEADIRGALFGPIKYAEALIAEEDGEAVGFALFFPTFSTFLGKPGIYIEDLFVLREARGRGHGKALLLEIVRLAAERGCGRIEWSVLDWNEPAIRFYEKLGAVPLAEWQAMRLSEAAIASLANATRGRN